MASLCTDSSVNFLGSLGYNVVSIPQEGITPLMVLTRDRNSHSTAAVFGDIQDMIAPPATPVPTIKTNLQAATINGRKTDRLDLSLGVSFLDVLLTALTGKNASIEIGFKNAKQIEFEYNNVLLDTVTPAAIARFLRSNPPDVDPVTQAAMDSDDKAFIIVDVLKSNRLFVKAYDEKGGGIDIDIDSIKAVVGVNSNIGFKKSNDLQVAVESETPLVFAVKVCPLWIQMVNGNPQFALKPATIEEDLVLRRSATTEDESEESEPESVLIAPNSLINLV